MTDEHAFPSELRRRSRRPRWQFLILFALLYATLIQALLPTAAQAARTAALAGLPAQMMLCQPGAMAEADAPRPSPDNHHGEACCLATCATQVSLSGPPVIVTQMAYVASADILPRYPLPPAATPMAAGRGPVSARGPPPGK